MNGRQNTPENSSRRQLGFTLVELMIAVAIIGILGMIAIPIYNQYIEKSDRSAASAVIETFPLLIENYRADNGMMCPACNATGVYTYNYTEDNAGNPTVDTITPNYPAFKPKGVGQNSISLYDYKLVVTVTGCPAACVESAVITAIAQANRGAPAGNIVSNPIN